MSERLNERLQPMMAFPGGRYGVAAAGNTGMTNGLLRPGDTGVMGATGPMGGPIDTQGFNRALVTVMTQGHTGTSQQAAITAKHGPNPWYSDSGTTAVNTFAITSSGANKYIQTGEIRTEKLQRYLWIDADISGMGESKFSVSVDLGDPDKLPTSPNYINEGP